MKEEIKKYTFKANCTICGNDIYQHFKGTKTEFEDFKKDIDLEPLLIACSNPKCKRELNKVLDEETKEIQKEHESNFLDLRAKILNQQQKEIDNDRRKRIEPTLKILEPFERHKLMGW